MDESKKSLMNQKFDKLVDECLNAFRIPGLALAVIDGQNSWEKVGRVPSFNQKPSDSI